METQTFNGINKILSEESDLKFFVKNGTYCLDLTHFSSDGLQIRETKFRDTSLSRLINQTEKALALDSKKADIACNYAAIEWLLNKGFIVTVNSDFGMSFITVNSKDQTEFDTPIFEERIDENPTLEKNFDLCNTWATDLILQIDPEFNLDTQKQAN